MTRALLILLACVGVARGASPIQSSNTWPYAVGWNLGVRGGIPARTGTIIDASLPPYGADKTGATNAGIAINAAITAASSNDIVYLPAGTYHCKTNAISLNKAGVLLRGDGSNTVVFGAITVGPSSSGNYPFTVTNGGGKGTTNLILSGITDTFGSTIAAGDTFQISSLENYTNVNFPVIDIQNGGLRIIKQMVRCHSRSGFTVTIDSPLVRDFTNSPILTSRILTGLGGTKSRMGIENIRFTGTNHGAGEVLTGAYTIFVTTQNDFWMSNVISEYCVNYALGLENVLRAEIVHCTFRHALQPVGTSRSGAIFTDTSEYLMRDCIFHDLGLAWQHFGGVTANAAVGVFTTNITADVAFLNHSSHNILNIQEACVFHTGVNYDGYFGSSSHNISYRNRNHATTAYKRFNSTMQNVGDALGNTAYPYVYQAPEVVNYPNLGSYAIFEDGFPNKGNAGFDFVAPPTSKFWPGTNHLVDNNTLETNYPNGVIVFSAVGPTNILYGNFTQKVASAESWTLTYAPTLVFQKTANTNAYYNGTNPPIKCLTNYGDRIVLNQFVTLENGDTLYQIDHSDYQSIDITNKYSHTRHGNVVYTNAAGTVVWDPNIPDHDLPASLLYPAGRPTWWVDYLGSAMDFPAFGPDVTGYAKMIPAQSRYLQLSAAGQPRQTAIGGAFKITGQFRMK